MADKSCFLPQICLILMVLVCDFARSYQQSSSSSQHSLLRKTPGAQAKGNELFCYNCDSMENPECVANVNNSNLFKKCKPEEFMCAVKRITFTISTENHTSSSKLWSLQRSCTSSCVRDGFNCIVIGERTKLYACTSCCTKSLCNVGDGKSSPQIQVKNYLAILVPTILTAFYL